VGLKNQQYCFLNKQYSKEEYEKKTEGILANRESLDGFKEFFEKESLKFPRRFARNDQAEDCSGDLIRNCQNCHDCFDALNQQDCRYCDITGEAHRMYDCTITGLSVENCYEQIACLTCYNCSFGVYTKHNQDCYYVMNCNNCKHCFGCEGISHKQYCIFNKQYSKEEYETVVAKLTQSMIESGEWGEMFPVDLSPFAYNETMAGDFFPLDKEEVLRRGWRYLEKSVDSKEFKILKQEEDFLNKYKIALPVKSPNARAKERFKRVLPYNLWERECAVTGEKLLSPYAPSRPEIILSEKAYLDYDFLR